MARLPVSVRRNLVELMRALPPGPMDRSQSPFWREVLFGPNADSNTWWHGSENSGHRIFQPPTKPKTRGTGIFLGDEPRASTYSGTDREATPFDAEDIFEDPALVPGLTITPNEVHPRQADFFEDAVLEPTYYVSHPDLAEINGTRDEIIDELHEAFAKDQPGNYPLLVRPGRYSSEIDWQGRNWDDGPEEPRWSIYTRPRGEDVPRWSRENQELDHDVYEEDVEGLLKTYRAERPNENVFARQDHTVKQYWTTDDAAREFRDMGEDTLLIRNLDDYGPNGYDYGGDTLVVFRPHLMRHAGYRGDGLPQARFDPRRRKKNDILAGLIGGASIAEALRRALSEEQETT